MAWYKIKMKDSTYKALLEEAESKHIYIGKLINQILNEHVEHENNSFENLF